MDSSDGGPSVLVVGLDGACFPVLEQVCERTELPTIQSILLDGVCGPMESQIPPWTASAWPSLFTGTNPGKHGVFDFLAFDGYDWTVVNGSHVRARPIWELLSEHGLTSVVVNVPVTHHTRGFDGALIPGMTAPEDPPCHPEGILDDVVDAVGEYRVYPVSGPDGEDPVDAYERTIAIRGAAFRYLAERFEPDFGFLQFQQTDSVFHERPHDLAAVDSVFEAVDAAIEATITNITPRNVLLVSDHGIGPVDGHEVWANELLSRRGMLSVTRGGDGMPDWSRAWENHLLSGHDVDEHDPGMGERLVSVAARLGLTTQRIHRTLDRLGVSEQVGKRVPNDWIRAGSARVDFANSTAYVRSKSELGVRINLEGREPAGVVDPDEFEAVRSTIIETLDGVRTPGGTPVFDEVVPAEAYFEGPYVDRGPDVLTIPRAFEHVLVHDLDGPILDDPREPWNHKRTGMVAASGPDVDTEVHLGDVDLFDVAPTICALFGLPADSRMDGSALPFVQPPVTREYPPYDPDPVEMSAEETVEARLSDLGYL